MYDIKSFKCNWWNVIIKRIEWYERLESYWFKKYKGDKIELYRNN